MRGFGTQFPAPAVVHVLVNVAVEVPGQPFFLYKKCPRFIEKLPNKPRAFMALRKKVYGVVITISKSRKPLAAQSEIGHLTGLQLQRELVCDQGDELTIGSLSLTRLLSYGKV